MIAPMRRVVRAAAILSVAAALPLSGAGKPSLNAYFQTTLTDAGYQKKVFEKVARTWTAPPSFPTVGRKTVVQAVITKEGKLASATVSTVSGAKAWDDAALAAVTKAAPFDRLPAGYAYRSVEVHFHFAVVP